MPTRPTHLNMAVAVSHHNLPGGAGGFEPAGLNRRCRFRSSPYHDFLSFPPPPLFQRSHSTPCFPSSPSADDPIARVKIVGGRAAPGVHALVVEAAIGMAFGARPVPATTGLGGAYFLRRPDGDCIAVIKPAVANEDPLALSRSSVSAAEIGIREAAAYLLDHAAFAGVPPTALIRISHPAFSGGSPPASRIASIQRFVPHDFDAGDLGPSRFSVASVHRIGILDVRLLNTDRHAGNLLVQKQRMAKNTIFDGGELAAELVPIDHGLCLPELLDDPYFEWLHWPQAAVPFNELETEYVSKLDPFKDAEVLRTELPWLREAAIRILILCTLFLKRAVVSGLCLADIGGMMTREFCRLEAGESVLEALCKKTEESLSDLEDGGIGDGDNRKEFQFAMDCEECGAAAADEDVLNIPLLLRSEREKSLDPLKEEEKEAEEMGGGLMKKSVSFSAGELNCDGGGMQGSKVVSFKNMSEEEWMLFLERFEQLLPEALEARKRMEVNQRLGSSCNF